MVPVRISATFGYHLKSALDILRLPSVEVQGLAEKLPDIPYFPSHVWDRVRLMALYEPYVKRQATEIRASERDEAIVLPQDFSYDKVHGLSNEERRILNIVRPANVGMARRCQGMTPASIVNILAYLRSGSKRAESLHHA